MHEHQLPTWHDIKRNTATSLDSAYSGLSDAGDWLRSDWRPAGTSLPDGDSEARAEARRLISEARTLINQAKNALGY